MPSTPTQARSTSAPSGPLLAVPNVSEGRDSATIDAIADAFASQPHVRLLDRHSDTDHHRSVFTLAGAQGALSEALLAGAGEAVRRVNVGPARVGEDTGQHPHVGAVDVVPLVYLDRAQRGAACAEALVVAERIGEQLTVPVFLYGELAGGRTRAELRRGGVSTLARRIQSGELPPDFGPSRAHPTAGATLVAAREPLVAFNVELAAPAGIREASRIAALIREGGVEGLPGVRAIGVSLHRGSVGQVSMNVERPLEVPLRIVLEAVGRHARVARAELVGLAPRAAMEGFPARVELAGFDPGVHVIENALGF